MSLFKKKTVEQKDNFNQSVKDSIDENLEDGDIPLEDEDLIEDDLTPKKSVTPSKPITKPSPSPVKKQEVKVEEESEQEIDAHALNTILLDHEARIKNIESRLFRSGI